MKSCHIEPSVVWFISLTYLFIQKELKVPDNLFINGFTVNFNHFLS